MVFQYSKNVRIYVRSQVKELPGSLFYRVSGAEDVRLAKAEQAGSISVSRFYYWMAQSPYFKGLWAVFLLWETSGKCVFLRIIAYYLIRNPNRTNREPYHIALAIRSAAWAASLWAQMYRSVVDMLLCPRYAWINGLSTPPR